MLMLINDRGAADKSYLVYTILTILVIGHGWKKENYWKLALTGTATCLIGGYAIYSNNFCILIPMGNSK